MTPTEPDDHHRAATDASAFALPEHLAAKADPALIADDERHFAAIASSLERTIADLTERLDAARRAPAGTGQAALDRDLEVHRLTARLRTLRRYGLDLCLGHVVPADGGDPVYVGRLGLTDGDGDRLLVDWRSPVAEPFFGATHADPMGLASRRRYRWTRGRVSDYWDEVFTTDALTGHAASLDDQSAFIASPRRHPLAADARRARHHRGRPGRHRAGRVDAARSSSTAARAPARPSSPCTAPPTCSTPTRASGTARAGCSSSARTSPTSPTSPTCCRASARRGCRPARCATSCRRAPRRVDEADPRVARLKADARLVAAIEPAVRLYEEPPTQGMEVSTPWGDVWVGTADWADAFDAPAPGAAHNESRDVVWEALLGILVDKLRDEADGDDADAGWPDDDAGPPEDFDAYGLTATDPSEKFRRALAADRELVEAFARAWPLIEPTDLVGDLWSVPAYLRRCAPWLERDELFALQREDPTAWTTADLPLLDAARRRLGDPEAPAAPRPPGGRRRRRARADGRRGHRPHRERRLRDARDVDAARPGPAHRARRRGCRAGHRLPTSSPGRSRTWSSTRRRS